MDASVTIPFPPDLFEALAARVAELLAERPPAQRYLDSEAAARYLGIAPKTLRTKAWRDQERIPYRQLASGRLGLTADRHLLAADAAGACCRFGEALEIGTDPLTQRRRELLEGALSRGREPNLVGLLRRCPEARSTGRGGRPRVRGGAC